jgi:hypothetical protein
MTNHQAKLNIIKMFIDNNISINEQLQIIKSVQDSVQFCKIAGMKCKQTKLF